MRGLEPSTPRARNTLNKSFSAGSLSVLPSDTTGMFRLPFAVERTIGAALMHKRENSIESNSSSAPRWALRVVVGLHRIREAPLTLRIVASIRTLRLVRFRLGRTALGKTLTQWVRRSAFLGRRFQHSQRERAYLTGQGTRAAWAISKLALAPLLLAVFATAVLSFGPALYSRYASQRRWPSLPEVRLDAYSGLLGTVAQAAAAMLALFFAAISLVASTNYAKVSTDIRTLVAEESTNRRYIRLLAHLAAVATLALGLEALGIPASAFLVGYVCLLAGVGLLAFLPLGVRTFSLFEPSTLSEFPLTRIERALAMVTCRGRHWRDFSFQTHANKITDDELRRLSDLVVFAITEDRPRQTVVGDLAAAVGRLTRFYAGRKHKIPSDSFWFTRRPEFASWDLASSSMTGITLQTGVAPQPVLVPDHSFLETQCLQLTVRCLQHLLSKDAFDDAVNLLLDANKTVSRLAVVHEQGAAMRLASAVRSAVMERLTGTAAIEPRSELQLVDVLCVSSLGPILYPSRALAETPLDALLGLDTSLLELHQRELYSAVRPRSVLKDAEDLFRRLTFERAVEGRIRTQPWYIRQIMASSYAEVIREVMKNIAEVVETEFLAPAQALAKATRSAAAGYMFQRGIEACHKARSQIEGLDARYAELRGFRVGGSEWIDSSSGKALARIDVARATIVRQLGAMVPELSVITPSGDLPDLLGQTRAWLAEELVSMMAKRDQKGFAELFSAYFNATISVQKHFVRAAQVPGKHDYVRVAMDAMLDLMDLSGLAVIFGELDETPFGKIVSRIWDVFFDRMEDKPAAVKAWYGAIRSKLSLPGLSPSAMQRQAWGQVLADSMHKHGIDLRRHFDGPWRKRPTAHKSPVIESIVVMYGHPLESPHDMFAALYISKRPEAQGIEVPNEVKDALESIDLARRRSEKTDEA